MLTKIANIIPLANTRDSIEKEPLKELADSMASVGLLQPVIVRKNGNIYELIAGHRRFQAAKLLKWEQIEVNVIETEDVKEIQMIENLQRKDINPMEEAKAIKLLTAKKYPKDVAAIIGKPLKYVLQRLKLNMLIKEMQKALLDGKLKLEAGLELCKYPEGFQKEICKNRSVERLTPDDVKKWMEDYQMLLSKASFDTTDDTLTKAGSCDGCEWRTSVTPLLFESKGDKCVNPGCFTSKEVAFVKKVIDRLKKEGKTVAYLSDDYIESSVMKQRISELGIDTKLITEHFIYKKSDMSKDYSKKLEAYEKKNKVDLRKDALRISSPGAGKIFKVYLHEDIKDVLENKKVTVTKVEAIEITEAKPDKVERKKRFERRIELSQIREFHELFKVQITGMLNAKLNFDNNFEPLVELLAMNFYDGLIDTGKLREYFSLGDVDAGKIKAMVEKTFTAKQTAKDKAGYLAFLTLGSLVSRFSTDPEYLYTNPLAIKLAEYMVKLGVADPSAVLKINKEYNDIHEKMKKNFDKNK
jgi:ParB family chromosome partitioning protein